MAKKQSRKNLSPAESGEEITTAPEGDALTAPAAMEAVAASAAMEAAAAPAETGGEAIYEDLAKIAEVSGVPEDAPETTDSPETLDTPETPDTPDMPDAPETPASSRPELVELAPGSPESDEPEAFETEAAEFAGAGAQTDGESIQGNVAEIAEVNAVAAVGRDDGAFAPSAVEESPSGAMIQEVLPPPADGEEEPEALPLEVEQDSGLIEEMGSLPGFQTPAELKAAVEVLLFTTPYPLGLQKLRNVLGKIDSKTLRGAISQLQIEYDARGGGLQIMENPEGFQMCTRPKYSEVVLRMHQQRKRNPLSMTALETLAIVAYKQPITRAEIEMIRGVESSGVVRNLMDMDLVKVVGRKEIIGRPQLYGTTVKFLKTFGLNSTADLPSIQSLRRDFGGEAANVLDKLAAGAESDGAGDAEDVVLVARDAAPQGTSEVITNQRGGGEAESSGAEGAAHGTVDVVDEETGEILAVNAETGELMPGSAAGEASGAAEEAETEGAPEASSGAAALGDSRDEEELIPIEPDDPPFDRGSGQV